MRDSCLCFSHTYPHALDEHRPWCLMVFGTLSLSLNLYPQPSCCCAIQHPQEEGSPLPPKAPLLLLAEAFFWVLEVLILGHGGKLGR